MAESLGGVIIYGILNNLRDRTVSKKKVRIDPKNLEAFDRVTSALIRSTIIVIKIGKITPHDSKTLVVEVPPLEDTSHQRLHDKRYYSPRALNACQLKIKSFVYREVGKKQITDPINIMP